ncbi:MAG: DNA-processing protein DprA [Patescibacteria group bacterium]
MSEKLYWLPFSVFPGIGPAKFKKLLEEFKTAKNAWNASSLARPRLAKLLGEKLTEKFEDFRNKFSIAEYSKKLKNKNVWFLILTDKDYPQDLLKINNPPFVLYGRGSPSSLRSSGPSVAVVGARRTTQYGREVTKLLTTDLVLNGFTIVSGLALGVDAISHMTALENGGKTIAVLGCGVDCCTPFENRKLYDRILQGQGAIISELPLGEPPSRGSFPARNRIIAGLSLGVLVTEGAEDSGSLITAEFARKFNRKIFAVPGPITSSMSKGPYGLIRKGAKLVTTAQDVINELGTPNGSGIKNQELRIKKGDTEEENVILKLLENEAVHFDEIVKRSKFSSSKLGSLLSMMEIKGLIKSLDGGMFSI